MRRRLQQGGNRSRAGLEAKRQCKFSTLDIPKRSPELNVMDYFVWAEVEKRLRRQERSWADGRKENRTQFIRRLKQTVARTPAHVVQDAIGNLADRAPVSFCIAYQVSASLWSSLCNMQSYTRSTGCTRRRVASSRKAAGSRLRCEGRRALFFHRLQHHRFTRQPCGAPAC